MRQMIFLALLLALMPIVSAGDWDHLANAPQYAPNTWGIMTTALHTIPGLGESQLFGDSFVFGVNIVPAEFARASDLKEAVASLVAAYVDCLNRVQGESRNFRINLLEGGAITRFWDVTPAKAKAAVNNSTIMEGIVEGGRQGEAMGMLDW